MDEPTRTAANVEAEPVATKRMDDLKERATQRAALLHASAAWGSDEDGYLIDRLLDRIEALEAENERLREALEWYVAEDVKYIRAALEARHD